MKKITLAAFAMVAASPALAVPCNPVLAPCPVPEISALQGTAALAALAAVVLLAWERRRRAA